MDIRANLYPCAHCGCTGTCTTAANGASCAYCVKAHDLKGEGHIGLPCGTCGGIGHAEASTERINKRVQPLLGLLVVYLLLIGVFASALLQSKYFAEILAFSGPLVGVVLAFYFTSRSAPRT